MNGRQTVVVISDQFNRIAAAQVELSRVRYPRDDVGLSLIQKCPDLLRSFDRSPYMGMWGDRNTHLKCPLSDISHRLANRSNIGG